VSTAVMGSKHPFFEVYRDHWWRKWTRTLVGAAKLWIEFCEK
jgi:hypothetical protein